MSLSADPCSSFEPPVGPAAGGLRTRRRGSNASPGGTPWVRLFMMLGLLLVILGSFSRVRDPRFWAAVFPGLAFDTTINPAPNPTQNAGVDVVPSVLPPVPLGGPAAHPANPPEARPSFNPLGLVQTEECKPIDPAILRETVRDKTGARPEEALLVQQLLCRAATTPPEELARLARRDLLFTNLVHESDRYRGVPVHRQGVLRTIVLHETDPDTHPYGLARYYQGWIFTVDQPTNPTLVLFSKLPDGMSPGEGLSHEVAIDAYYLKLYAFRSEDRKTRFAPMLIGYAPEWSRLNLSPGVDIGQAMLALAAVALLGVGYILWQRRRDALFAERLARPSSVESGSHWQETHDPERTTSTEDGRGP